MATVDTQSTLSTRTHETSTLPHVLLLVDDAHKTEALEMSLKRERFDVTTVSTIAEAMAAMTKHSPQVVITESADSGALIPLVRTFGHVDSVSIVVLTDETHVTSVFGGEIAVDNKTAARDVAQLARIELMSRSTKQLDFGAGGARPELVLRVMLATGRSGRLILQHGAEITFDSGSVVALKMGSVTTVDSMAHALALSEACSLRLEPVLEPEGRVATGHEFVELVVPRVTRFRNALGHAVALDARLGVDFAKLAKALPDMPDDVNRVVRLFDGHRLMRNVIVDSPFDEALTLEIATRLSERGIVKPVEHAQTQHAVAPKLFDPDAIKPKHEPQLSSAPVSVNVHKLDAIDPELEKQLQAFNTKAIVETVEPKASKPVRQYAQGVESAEDASLESAMHAAMVDGATEFERAVTPVMSPVVQLTQVATPDATVDLEHQFFSATTADEAVAPVEEVAAKTEQEHVAKHTTRWSLYAAGAIAVLALAVFIERVFIADDAAPVTEPVVVKSADRVIEVEEPVFIEETSADLAQQISQAAELYRQGDYPTAIYKLEQVVTADPASEQAWLLLGLARYDANDNFGAREAADQVMALNAKNARAHMLDATLQFDAKNKDKAHAALQKYLELEPEGQFAHEAEALLKR